MHPMHEAHFRLRAAVHMDHFCQEPSNDNTKDRDFGPQSVGEINYHGLRHRPSRS